MMNAEQIKNELLRIDSNVSTYATGLERECGEMTDTMNKTQSVFGDQQPGQELVSTLYRTMEKLITSEKTLQILRQEIHNCVLNVQK